MWLRKERIEIQVVFKILKRKVQVVRCCHAGNNFTIGIFPTLSSLPHLSRICYFLKPRTFSPNKYQTFSPCSRFLSQIFQNVAISSCFCLDNYFIHNRAEILHFPARCPHSTSCHRLKFTQQISEGWTSSKICLRKKIPFELCSVLSNTYNYFPPASHWSIDWKVQYYFVQRH